MAGRSTGFSHADSSLLDELLDVLDQDPNNIEAKKLLAGQWQSLGWDEAAANIADEILAVAPSDREAQFILDSTRRGQDSPRDAQDDDAPPPYSPPAAGTAEPAGDVRNTRQLKAGYKKLLDDARSLLSELLCFQKIAPNSKCEDQIEDLTAITEGRIHSVARRTVGRSSAPTAGPSDSATRPPQLVQALASSMKVDKGEALSIAIADFEDCVQWAKTRHNNIDDDVLRDNIRKRAESLEKTLPKKMSHMAMDAFMHVEHEKLKRQYLNSETMLMEPIDEIDRADFWASEDGYAWDINELVQAIRSNGGAMRNPLSGEMFTPSDVKAIIRHPKGAELAAVQVEQNKLSKGVRQETITKMRQLATVILEDQSANSHPSHEAVEAFFGYMATLPASEQEALDKLRVPARDSHTGKAFDMTVGDSVRDAKSNQICFHKAGDLLKQAADFLSKGR